MQRRWISEAAGPHLRHRVSALPSLTPAGLQAADVSKKTVPIDHGNNHSGSPRFTSARSVVSNLQFVP